MWGRSGGGFVSVKETSIKSYMQLKDTGELTNQQRQVLQLFINEMPCTRNEVAEDYGWKNGTISGRTKELVDKGFLTCIGKREDEFSGRRSEVFTVNEQKVLEANKPLFVDNNKKQEEENEDLEPGDVIFE